MSCRKREDIVEEVDKGRRGSRRESSPEGNSSKSRSAEQQQESGRPPAVAADRSTGPVDRRAQHAQKASGRPQNGIGRPTESA